MIRRFCFVLATVLIALPAGLRAQDPANAEAVAEARALFNGGDYEAAVALAAPLAEAGEPGAINVMGVAYVTGRGVEADVERGLALMNEAADAGFERALLSLGQFHERGLFGVPQDLGLAASYYTRAVDLGSVEGMVRIAEMLLTPM